MKLVKRIFVAMKPWFNGYLPILLIALCFFVESYGFTARFIETEPEHDPFQSRSLESHESHKIRKREYLGKIVDQKCVSTSNLAIGVGGGAAAGAGAGAAIGAGIGKWSKIFSIKIVQHNETMSFVFLIHFQCYRECCTRFWNSSWCSSWNYIRIFLG